MLSRVLLFRVLPVALALALSAAALIAGGLASAVEAGPERLPDLDQATPAGLVITSAGSPSRPVYRLGFRSAVSNVGDGPLLINGHRSDVDPSVMTADQVIERDGAPQRLVPAVGKLRYTISADHRHWHLLDFDRYKLRRAGHKAAAASDRKTGFCLGDRYRVTSRSLPAGPPQAVHTSRCGLGNPGLSSILEGISVGYGDDYAANLEGQYLPLTGLPAGRYVLVHRVNADGRLREVDYANNAASLLLELRWQRGQPYVRILKQCPDTDRCDRAPARLRGPAQRRIVQPPARADPELGASSTRTRRARSAITP